MACTRQNIITMPAPFHQVECFGHNLKGKKPQVVADTIGYE